MNFKGVIIEESLTNSDIIKELEIIDTEVSKTTFREKTPWLQQWTLQTVVIPFEKIQEYTEKLSRLIDTNHCAEWYCDFRNNDIHYVVFANKVFKLNRLKKQDYLEMQNYAITLGVPEYQLPTFHDLPTSMLIEFLINAKKKTYANGDASKTSSNRLGSNDYHYEEEKEGEIMRYHDTYFGGVKFMGEEVVYRGIDIPKWGMNYYGIVLDEELSEEAMDKVLRPALKKVGEDDSVIPVRGPSQFASDGYVYTFKNTGTIENFTGLEEIYKSNILIYQLHCQGGIIE